MQQKIKGTLNSGNANYHSVNIFFPSRLLSRNKSWIQKELKFCLLFVRVWNFVLHLDGRTWA